MSPSGLKTPPTLAPGTLRVIPLGGLGDIGRNMTSFEIDGQLLLVDCGVLFPEDDHPGVDLLLPAFELIQDRLQDVVGLVLTHGHEDHIGAVPYLLRQRPDLPLYGSKLTLALVEAKLKEHRLAREAVLKVVGDDTRVEVGNFDLEFMAVNHSIPDGLAVAIRTEGGTVLHTGDFKMDQLPLDGRITDLRRFAKLGEEGVDLFMSDSTNAETPGFTPLEKDIAPAMERVVATSEQMIIVTCFSSHIHRVQQVLDVAHLYERKVVFVGRSMVRNMTVAADLGYLTVPPKTLVDLKDIESVPREDLIIVSTGSQGEPLSALARIANQEHPIIRLDRGDTVLLASSLIPGNENAVFRVINGLAKLGATVVHKGNAMVHVSGHASSGELLYCYNIVRPANAMPVHGEPRHLIANADLAVATGVPRDRALVCQDGSVVDLRNHRARIVGQVDAPYIFVDGTTVGDISESQLVDRKILGEEGFISVIAVVNTRSNKLLTGPDIHARGFAEDDAIFEEVRQEVANALRQSLEQDVDDVHRLQQTVRRVVGRWVNKTYRRRPMIVPVIIEA
ncbi:RNase J family beta-CASP ribonuclease [Raineyella fluvialis]|uniref:Ribonuclease J n=1 Tax=Raineyella fluvialis TaxID=2662261 RepID=A0A5Q2FDT3_9ACTN|nr:RNase J family beta-CASP ribonuclease [Raineyella fluvialis]